MRRIEYKYIVAMLAVFSIFMELLDSTVVRFKAFFRLAFFVPYAIPGIIAALLWGYLYDPALSPIVKGISGLGLGTPDFLGARAVLWSIANIATWAWTGYNMLIIFAALQAIPTDIYESARIDGSSGFHIAWHIKIPLVAPALVLTGIFSIIGTLQLDGVLATRNMQLLIEYFNGRSPNGQFYREKIEFIGLGTHFHF